MNHSYTKNVEVRLLETNHDQELNIVCLVDHLNDVGGSHLESLGYSLESLFKKGYAWILLSWNIHIDKLPPLKEKIQIKTWVSKINRYFVYREFLMVDHTNQVIVQVSSQWLFYYIFKRKPVKIFPDLSNKLTIDSDNAYLLPIIDSSISRRPVYLNSEKRISVQPKDIDILGHVHNSKYIEWVMELKPERVKQQYKLQNLQVQYHHEVKYPGEIIIKQYLTTSEIDDQQLIYDKIWNKNDQKISAEVTTQWKYVG